MTPLEKRDAAFNAWTTRRGYAPAADVVAFRAGWDAAVEALLSDLHPTEETAR